jgi:hypothetical protein
VKWVDGVTSTSRSLTVSGPTAFIAVYQLVPDFTVTASPTLVTILQGSSGVVTVYVNSRNGFAGTVTVTAFPPTGMSATPSPNTVGAVANGQTSYSLAIAVGASFTPGTYPVTFTGTEAGFSSSASTTVAVTCPSSGCSGGGGGGGGASLAYGTLITMLNGSLAPVQSLKVGDQMLGYDPLAGQYRVSTVTSIVVKNATDMLVVNTQTGTPLRVDSSLTEVLWTRLADGTTLWQPVTQLQVGQSLLTQNGWVAVTSINFASGGNHTMWDVTATAPYFASGYLDPPHPS